MSTTTAPVGNDAKLAQAIMYAEYIVRALHDARDNNAVGHYDMVNCLVNCVQSAMVGLTQLADGVHDDVVWRVR